MARAMQSYILNTPQARQAASQAVLNAPAGMVVSITEQKRSSEASAKMWAMLGEVAQQVVWHGQKLSPEDWKNVFSASLKKQRVVPSLDGGFVVMAQSTSKMTKSEMSDLIQLIDAFGAEKNVRFSTNQDLPEL